MPMPRLPETHHRKHRDKKSLPGKKEECRDRAHVKQAHESCGYPIDFVVGGWLAVKRFELHCGVPVFVVGARVSG